MTTQVRAPGPALRLLSYNIRHCRGMDGCVALDRIAAVIDACRPDIVALQEVDAGRARTGGLDQARALANRVGLHDHFHAALRVGEERYGDAILTRHPSHLVRAGGLPGMPGLEPRGALWIEVSVGTHRLQVLNTHLGLRAAERSVQVAALLGPDWLGSAEARGPVVLMGDMNATPWSRAYRQLARTLTDARRIAHQRAGNATFPSRCPVLRLDHVFVGAGITVDRVMVLRDGLARNASDHRPLLAEIGLPAETRDVHGALGSPSGSAALTA
ncbi:hypothetical protein CFIICLFH_0268 [Methylobacterium goesingense]|uniref:Endonuclease/exonuclease/phosphatase family metal-dependent hydrolase n=1 Tax=Methylobacterium goesingense TaxID=243690 RepID=A0ABV2L590_9HYPH|nr:endonuclease/exonuclease/phosphatase family protein [Methylobacterium goesingense]GJD72058.1 hypothetical protein CFIICLFH_0268 [Methylobacterium goesingense]